MDPTLLLVCFIATALFAYSAFVTWRILRFNGSTSAQKFMQVAMTWLLPLVGVLVVHMILSSSSDKKQAPPDRQFIPQESGPTLSSFLDGSNRPH